MTATLAEPRVLAPTREDALRARKFGKSIGEGLYRETWRFREEPWVFKFVFDHDNPMNRTEFAARQRIIGVLPPNIRIPEMVLLPATDDVYGDILAAVYVPGGRMPYCDEWTIGCRCGYRPCWMKRAAEAQRKYDLCDLMNVGNVRIDADDVMWILDLGEMGSEW